jgi:integrase
VERFEDYASRWLDDAVHLRAGTRAKYLGHLRTHIFPTFGDRALDAIEPSQVRSWVAAMSRGGSSAGTVATVYRTLATILRSAEINRAIDRTPCIGVKLPRDDDRREMTFLDPEEILRLADAIADRYRALVLVAAYSGARFGELAYLKVDAVNFLSGAMQIRGSLAEVDGRLIEQGTKTGKWRTVTLPRSVVQILGEHIGKYPSTEGHVFSAPKGGPLRRRAWYKRSFKPAVERAGLDPRLRFHDLRHTHAALLIAQGEHAKVIADRLGHARPTMTMDVYAHILPGLEEQAVSGLEATFSGNSKVERTPS